MTSPDVYVVAGPNGAGKTTFAKRFLPYFADCREYINADYIAAGLSPLDPGGGEWRAGRVMLEQIRLLVKRRKSFGCESTLAGRSYLHFLKNLGRQGYRIHIFFLWVTGPNLAIARVKDRVRQGGHAVPEPVIRRRFARGLKNFFEAYAPLANAWMLVDNSLEHPRMIAYSVGGNLHLEDEANYRRLQKEIGH
jgi:predicted ABC-type ATPase